MSLNLESELVAAQQYFICNQAKCIDCGVKANMIIICTPLLEFMCVIDFNLIL